jgi:alpha-amylase/alpha-mannosidase (GH57 family)
LIPGSTPAAHVAAGPSLKKLYCYSIYSLDQQFQRLGALTLSVGQLRIVSDLTWEARHLVFAVLHLGGWDFHCQIQPFSDRLQYAILKEALLHSLRQGSAAHTILTMTQCFPNAATFGLRDLFAEDRQVLMQRLTTDTLNRLDQIYTQVYRDNYGVLLAFHRDGLTVPQELQVAAEVTLNRRLADTLKTFEQHCTILGQRLSQVEDGHWLELNALASEAAQINYEFQATEARQSLERLLWRSLWQFLYDTDPAYLVADLNALQRLLNLGRHLKLYPGIDRLQELYYLYLQNHNRHNPDLHHQPAPNQAVPNQDSSLPNSQATREPGLLRQDSGLRRQAAIPASILFELATILELKLA